MGGVALFLICVAGIISPSRADSLAARMVTVTEKDNHTEVTLAVGDTLAVRLEVQFGAGFSWRLAHYDGSRLRFKGRTDEYGTADRPGSVEHQLFQFSAVETGRASVRLEYVRPWERDARPTKIFELGVRIDKPGAP